MNLVALLLVLMAQVATLLIDFATVLTVVHLLCSWRPVPILVEFDSAGRPLIDRCRRVASRGWRWIAHGRSLPRRWESVWILSALAVARWIIAVALHVLCKVV